MSAKKPHIAGTDSPTSEGQSDCGQSFQGFLGVPRMLRFQTRWVTRTRSILGEGDV
jgi:hypothetical protein